MSCPSISALTAGTSRSAWMQAFTKKPMKPSFTPWRFSNRSLYSFLQLHDGAHVHVVERGEHRRRVLRILEAAGDGLAQPRHAHALLARGIVRHRGRAHLRSGHRRRRHRPRRGGHGLGRRRPAAGLAAAAITSSFSIWPRRPEPCTSAAERPFSSIILRAAGARRHVAPCLGRGGSAAGGSTLGRGLGGRRRCLVSRRGAGEAAGSAGAGALACCAASTSATRHPR